MYQSVLAMIMLHNKSPPTLGVRTAKAWVYSHLHTSCAQIRKSVLYLPLAIITKVLQLFTMESKKEFPPQKNSAPLSKWTNQWLKEFVMVQS